MKMKVCSISIWCMVMAVILAAASATLTWELDTGDPEKYSSFLNSLREEFGLGTPKVCNLPVTNKNNNQKYVLVNLVTVASDGNTITITLAFRASDAYLVGYQDKVLVNNVYQLRANFFKDTYNELESKKIFAGPTDKQKLPVESTYRDLIDKSSFKSRQQVNLGVPSLKRAIERVYGINFKAKGNNPGQVVADFALIAIQMVSEAARFKYIEGEVKTRGMKGSFQAGATITLLENNWSSLSKQYHNPDRQCKPQHTEFTEDQMKLGLLQYSDSRLNANHSHAMLAFI